MFQRKFTFVLLFVIIYLTSAMGQSFTEEMEAIADIIVDINGSGDYASLREGISAIPDESTDTTIVFVKKGIYDEKVILPHTKWNVILVGEDLDSTIITGDDYGDQMLVDGNPAVGGHTFSTYTFRADPHGFQVYNITFENTATAGQGVAFHSNGDKQILYHCRMLGYQDTYFDNFRTRRYIKDCFIEGQTDYIFGFGVTLFDSCQIYTLGGASEITASATGQYYEFGHVFKNCWLTAPPSLTTGVSLGRPWFDYANTIFYECWEGKAIKSGGWSSWDGREATCIYREYNCNGPGYSPDTRNIGKILVDSLASRYVMDTILAVSNFPTELGSRADTVELLSMRNRFAASGYTARADTVLYAGRDTFPSYPTDNWSPVFHEAVYKIMKKYQVALLDSANTKCSLDSVYMDGVKIEDFTTENTYFPVELAADYEGIPDFLIYNSEGEAVYSYPGVVPGIVTLTVHSANQANQIQGKVFLSKDSAFWNPEPLYFVFNRKDTVYIQEGVSNYTLTLSNEKTSVTNFKLNRLLGQTYYEVEPDSLPGEYKVIMKAPSEVDSIVYTITVNPAVGFTTKEIKECKILVTNPVEDKLQVHCTENINMPGTISIYNLSGKKLFTQQFVTLSEGVNEFSIESIGLSSGIFLYRIQTDNILASGKLIKL